MMLDWGALAPSSPTTKTIPFEQGRLLFDSLTGPKTFYPVEGADHINTHRLDSAAYMLRVPKFVQECRARFVH